MNLFSSHELSFRSLVFTNSTRQPPSSFAHQSNSRPTNSSLLTGGTREPITPGRFGGETSQPPARFNAPITQNQPIQSNANSGTSTTNFSRTGPPNNISRNNENNSSTGPYQSQTSTEQRRPPRTWINY